jgi:uncharacterized protein
MRVLILPGYGNSGPDHWQTHWEKAHPDFVRVQQKDWENPRREDWLVAIDQAVSAANGPVILVAHSLACLAVAHWGQNATTSRPAMQAQVKWAMLVAPPDPQASAFPPAAADFGPVAKGRLAFPGTLVYSTNDVYSTESFALRCARDWHCETFSVGALGHINSASKLERWPQGFALLDKALRSP